MKKYVTLCALLCLFALMTCTTALAADAEINVLNTAESVSAVPDGEKINVVYSAAENGSQYLVLATTEDARVVEDGGTVVCKPTKDNIIYIDQTDAAGAADGKAAFVVYPSELDPGTYYIFLSSNAGSGIQGLTEIASFQLSDGTTVVILGDLDGEDGRTLLDVMTMIRLVVNMEPLETVGKVADMNDDDFLDLLDVMALIQLVANQDTGLPE